jgi:hypothetical protein
MRIGFQKIVGLSFQANKLKDDIIWCLISQWDFDVFVLIETNVYWCLIHDEHKLHFCMKEWRDSLHISSSHKRATAPVKRNSLVILHHLALTRLRN